MTSREGEAVRERCGPRVAIYTHDTFGLGHIRRCLHVLRALADADPEAALLLVTGSPALHRLGSLPAHADFVKIPTIARTGRPEARPPHLPIPLREVTALRRRLVRQAVLAFEPDVFLVDNFPLGSRKELLPTLEALRGSSTRTVLGLRDVLDWPETVRAQWTRDDVYRALEQEYDAILVYGGRETLDLAEAYALPRAVAAKLRYCGYVTGAATSSRRAAAGAGGPAGPPALVASVGGGGDGLPLLRAFLEALSHPALSRASALVVTGPLMSAADRALVRRLGGTRRDVEIRDAVEDLPARMAAADVVVAMAGYNTVAEILALERPAVLVPRTWRYGEHATHAGEEGEQLLRARALERAGLAEVVHPDALTPEALACRIVAARNRRAPSEPRGFDLGGRERVRDAILELARSGAGGRRRVA